MRIYTYIYIIYICFLFSVTPIEPHHVPTPSHKPYSPLPQFPLEVGHSCMDQL